jgi:hypothetical protein
MVIFAADLLSASRSIALFCVVGPGKAEGILAVGHGSSMIALRAVVALKRGGMATI